MRIYVASTIKMAATKVREEFREIASGNTTDRKGTWKTFKKKKGKCSERTRAKLSFRRKKSLALFLCLVFSRYRMRRVHNAESARPKKQYKEHYTRKEENRVTHRAGCAQVLYTRIVTSGDAAQWRKVSEAVRGSGIGSTSTAESFLLQRQGGGRRKARKTQLWVCVCRIIRDGKYESALRTRKPS